MSKATWCDLCGCFYVGRPTAQIELREWDGSLFDIAKVHTFDLCEKCKNKIDEVIYQIRSGE